MGALIAVALSACGTNDDIDRIELCDAVCDCVGITRLDRNQCYQECLGELDPSVPEACVECAQEDSCVALDACLDDCFGAPRSP
jgi:hypothetical protein